MFRSFNVSKQGHKILMTCVDLSACDISPAWLMTLSTGPDKGSDQLWNFASTY